MNIAIASTFHPYRGGIAAFNDRLALSLKDAGHNVHCLNWSRQYPSLLFPVETQTISGHNRPKGSDAPLDSINPRSWQSTAKRILEKGDIEILILPFWHASLAPALRSVAKRVKKLSPDTKVIALMHNASPHDGSSVDKWLTKRFLKQVDSAITLSDSVKNGVIKLRPDLDCRVLFHPLYDHYKPALEKDEARAKLGISPEVDLGLFFGLIRPYKGLDVLLESMANTSNHLLIAGEAYESWGNYSKLIDKYNLGDRIHTISRFVDEDELPVIFGASDCLILPYKKASQSGVVATALHYNTPIIASRVGDLENSVIEGKTGKLVHPQRAEELGDAINDWFSNPQSKDSVSKEYRAIKDEKSWSKFADQLLT